MIHRQDTLSLCGVPVSSSSDIEDSEAVLSAIRLTPPDQSIDFMLHTPGGLVVRPSKSRMLSLSIGIGARCSFRMRR
jgi:ClpP class serine protease